MAKPFIHAESSARRFGGKPEDYLPIHEFLDSSKGAIADNRHRALTHNSWFLSVVVERVFGAFIVNSAGKKVSPREVAEQHVLEDYRMRFIPSAADFLMEMEFRSWMNNGQGCPPSFARLFKREGGKLVEGGPACMTFDETLKAKNELEKKVEEMREAMKAQASESFVAHFKPFFEKYPNVKGITWTAYTPYFNDGDACTFGSNHDYPDVLVDDDDGELVRSEDSNRWEEFDEPRRYARDMFPEVSDDDMLAFFGDHVRVTIYSDRIDVEDYERHD